MSSEEVRSGGLYYQVIDGTFRQSVKPEHPDAIRRDYETSDGKTGTKYERIVHGLTGVIESIQFKDSEFGKQINIRLDANSEGKHPVISLGCASRFGEDLLKKLPNVDLEKEVHFRPFSFVPQGEEKEVKGMELTQQDGEGKFTIKILNAFVNSKTREYFLDYPKPEDGAKDKWDADEWKYYFAQARKFTIAYIENNIISKLKSVPASHSSGSSINIDPVEYPSEEVNVDDIPF